MTDSKPFASLSSGLLARKGGAKPAMRPQVFGSPSGNIEDLGWDDMGLDAEAPEHVPSSIAALTPASAAVREPVVQQQLAKIEASFAPEAKAPPAARRRSNGNGHAAPERLTARQKAAFTLRLDPERHLKLRLACAVAGRSAQQIVTEALDRMIEALPEIDALAGQLPARSGTRN
jgi:hypothetical protein